MKTNEGHHFLSSKNIPLKCDKIVFLKAQVKHVNSFDLKEEFLQMKIDPKFEKTYNPVILIVYVNLKNKWASKLSHVDQLSEILLLVIMREDKNKKLII